MRPTLRRTHFFSRATTRRMTTPGVVLGLHPETMRSVREDFFLRVPNDSRETIHGRAFPYRAFVPKGRRAFTRGRSFVHTFKGARTATRVRRAVHGAVRSTGIVLPHRDELPARSRPRVQPVRVSSTRSSPERRDDARRGDACIIDQMKTSSFNRRRAHSSPSVRALARERNDGANERTRDRWDVDVSRLDAMTRRTVRIGSIRFVQKSATRQRTNESAVMND